MLSPTTSSDWLTSLTASTCAATTATIDTGVTFTLPDSYVDWLPNSCLYPKYLPTWHLVQSYKVD